jgi:hypothetical protein
VFNNGFGSVNQPAGAAAGETRSFSAISAYRINALTRTAEEVYNFSYGESIYSAICGSTYEAPGHTFLLDYAFTDNGAHARLVGLDSQNNVVFDFQYANRGCNTSWNAVPIHLESMDFT